MLTVVPAAKFTGHFCKRCKGKFETMADMNYHACVPQPFKRPVITGQKITKQTVSALQPNGAEQFLWDSGDGALKGFGVRMSPNGVASYLVQYRNAAGSSRRLVLGRVGVLTPDQARQDAREKLVEVAKGADPSEDRRAVRAELTWGELCDWYITEAKAGRIVNRKGRPIKPSTVAADEGRIANHVKPQIGDKPLSWLTLDRATKLQADIAVACAAKARQRRPGSAAAAAPSAGKVAGARALGMLEAIWGHGRRGLGRTAVPGENPFSDVQRYAHNHVTRYLTVPAYGALGQAMRTAAADGASPTLLSALRALMLTGCRKMEILAMPRTTFDAAGHCLRLVDSKTGPQMRPIGIAAVDHLTAQLAISRQVGSEFMFPGDYGAVHANNPHPTLARLCKMAGLAPGLTPHMLRHSFASMAAELGYSELVIKGLLGHAAAGVTQRYAHVPDAALLGAADRVSLAIAAALDGQPNSSVITSTAAQNAA